MSFLRALLRVLCAVVYLALGYAFAIRIYRHDIAFVPVVWPSLALPAGFHFAYGEATDSIAQACAVGYLLMVGWVIGVMLATSFPKVWWQGLCYFLSLDAVIYSGNLIAKCSRGAQHLVGKSFLSSGIREPLLPYNVLFLSLPALLAAALGVALCVFAKPKRAGTTKRKKRSRKA